MAIARHKTDSPGHWIRNSPWVPSDPRGVADKIHRVTVDFRFSGVDHKTVRDRCVRAVERECQFSFRFHQQLADSAQCELVSSTVRSKSEAYERLSLYAVIFCLGALFGWLLTALTFAS